MSIQNGGKSSHAAKRRRGGQLSSDNPFGRPMTNAERQKKWKARRKADAIHYKLAKP